MNPGSLVPTAGTLEVFSRDSNGQEVGSPVPEISVGESGKFLVSLPPGWYRIHAYLDRDHWEGVSVDGYSDVFEIPPGKIVRVDVTVAPYIP